MRLKKQISRTLPRSFGFPFRDILFGGTLLQLESGQNDAHVFYDGAEYEGLQQFFDAIKPTEEEQKDLLSTLNRLIK